VFSFWNNGSKASRRVIPNNVLSLDQNQAFHGKIVLESDDERVVTKFEVYEFLYHSGVLDGKFYLYFFVSPGKSIVSPQNI
jgi:hypothetical protein